MVIPVHRCSSHLLRTARRVGPIRERGGAPPWLPAPRKRLAGSTESVGSRPDPRVRSPGTRAKCPRRGVEWLDRLSSGSAQRGSGWAGTNPQGFYSPEEPLPCPPVWTSPLREPLAGLSVTHMLTSVTWQCTDSTEWPGVLTAFSVSGQLAGARCGLELSNTPGK